MKKENCTTSTTLQINAAVDLLKDLNQAIRAAESATAFELALNELERIIEILELLNWARGA